MTPQTESADLLGREHPAWCDMHQDGSPGWHESTEAALGDWRLYLAADGWDKERCINLAHVGGVPETSRY